MASPTFYPTKWGLGFRIVQQGVLAVPGLTVTLGSNGGGPVAAPSYFAQCFFDGTVAFAGTNASVIPVTRTLPTTYVLNWTMPAGARWIRIVRSLASVNRLIYEGDGRDIISPTSFLPTPFRFEDVLKVADATIPSGRPITIPPATPNGWAEYIDCRAGFGGAALSPSGLIGDAGGRKLMDLSKQPVENVNLDLRGKKRGLRKVVPVKFAFAIGGPGERSALMLWNAEMANPDSTTAGGLFLQMSLNVVGAIESTSPQQTTWRAVRLIGDLPMIGDQERNMLYRFQWDFAQERVQRSVGEMLTPDAGAGLW